MVKRLSSLVLVPGLASAANAANGSFVAVCSIYSLAEFYDSAIVGLQWLESCP